jgi:hypothetical protein
MSNHEISNVLKFLESREMRKQKLGEQGYIVLADDVSDEALEAVQHAAKRLEQNFIIARSCELPEEISKALQEQKLQALTEQALIASLNTLSERKPMMILEPPRNRRTAVKGWEALRDDPVKHRGRNQNRGR